VKHDPDCMHMEMEDAEGPFTLHIPPSVFEVIFDLVDQNDGEINLPLGVWEDGAIPIYVEREDRILRYAFRMPS